MYNTKVNFNLGSIGFAQLGRPDYHEKRQVERRVLVELLDTPTFENTFPDLCSIRIVREQYEDSSYDEVGIVYDSRKVDNLEETDEDRYNEFWAWVNELEDFDFETEELMDKCAAIYAAEYKLSVVHVREEEEAVTAKMKAI